MKLVIAACDGRRKDALDIILAFSGLEFHYFAISTPAKLTQS
jgi:hypothetical protein